MSQVRYESIGRMNWIADQISAGKQDLLPNCQAVVGQDLMGIVVRNDKGFTVGVGVEFIDNNPFPSIIGYIRDQLNEWALMDSLSEPPPQPIEHRYNHFIKPFGKSHFTE